MLLMPKLDDNSETPQYIQLYDYIKNEIVYGRIAEHTRLPSVRKLADFLAISTTPVEMAYGQLQAEGFIESKPRSGYYVQKVTDSFFQPGSGKACLVERKAFAFRDEKEYEFDFHLSKNDFSHFPFQIWRKLSNQVLRLEQKELLYYGDPQGEQGLRRQIANYLHQYRGVTCSPEQVVIGAEQHLLLSFLSMMLKNHSSGIGVENPGYVLVPATFQQHGYKIIPISLEDDGINIGELYESNVRLVSVSPSHQFPRGMIMPISKRLQLLEWAKKTNGYIIEDDYDGEFRYHGRPVQSLQGILPDTNVVYLGGFSQVLAPAICVNYMVLPETLLDAFRQLQYQLLFEQSSSRLHQKTLQLFMERGYLEKHVRKMRNIYRKKHDLLIDSIQKHFQGKAAIIGKDAGFHLLLQVDSPQTEEELIESAKSAGIRISSAAFTWLQPPKQMPKEFFIGFGGIAMDKIEEGIKRLKEAWFGCPAKSRP